MLPLKVVDRFRNLTVQRQSPHRRASGTAPFSDRVLTVQRQTPHRSASGSSPCNVQSACDVDASRERFYRRLVALWLQSLHCESDESCVRSSSRRTCNLYIQHGKTTYLAAYHVCFSPSAYVGRELSTCCSMRTRVSASIEFLQFYYILSILFILLDSFNSIEFFRIRVNSLNLIGFFKFY